MATIVQDWFEVSEAEPGLFIIAEPFHFENVKSYLIAGAKRAILVDTGMGVGNIREVAESLTDLPISVVNSHAHWDHVGGNHRFREIAIHPAEAADLEEEHSAEKMRRRLSADMLTKPLPPGTDLNSLTISASKATSLLNDGDVIDLGERRIEILHAPGHSPGGIALIDDANGFMLSTDVAYLAPLYAYNDDSDPVAYVNSLRRMEDRAGSLKRIYPSHDATPIDPKHIGSMRRAMEAVVEGRARDETNGQIAIHQFGDFSIMVRDDFVPGSPA